MIASTPILAAFLTPALFYGGLAGVSIPILIHLLARRRFRRIRWAAIEFLLEAERRNRRRLRMEEWILLALRCLAIALLGLLVARPFFTPKSAAALWGGSRRTDRVFVLDDSMSMAYESTDGTSFARAKTAMKRLIEAIRREAPDDTVTLIRMSAYDQPVETGVYLDDAQTDSLFARLEAFAPSQRAVNSAAVMGGVAEILNRGKDVLNAVVYIISDFQRNDWIAREAAASDRQSVANPLAPLGDWAGEKRGLRIVMVNIGDANAVNRAVSEVRSSDGPTVAGTSSTLRVHVHNYSDRAIENLPLQMTVGVVPQPTRVLPSLTAGQGVSVDLSAEFLLPGDETVKVEIPADGLPIDDAHYAAVNIASAVHVLLVNGEQSADSFEDETMFLATALRPEGDVFSGNEVTVIDETQLESENLDRFQTVVLANVYRLGEQTVESLERFAQSGGGIIIFTGDQVDPGLYNTMLYRDGAGLLPAQLGEVVRAETDAHLVMKDRLHPVVAGVSREGDPLGIGRIPFFQYLACEVASEKQLSGDAGTEKPVDSKSGRPVRIVAAFDDVVEHPAIVERSFGAGKVVLVTTTADKEWHLWPDHPTYVPLMIELVRYVARSASGEEERLVGSPIALPVDPAEFEPDVIVRTPSFPAAREASVTAVPVEDGSGLAANWPQTDVSGVYQFVLRKRDGGEVVRMAAVNVDPRESDLTGVREDELRRALGGPGAPTFEYIQGLSQLPSATGESRIEFWRPVLITLFSLLMVEQFLAWWWGRKR